MTSKLGNFDDPLLDSQIEEIVYHSGQHREELDDHESRLVTLETIEDWIAPTLLNSWVNYNPAYAQAGYYKDPFGVVHLRGLLKSGALGNVPCFTLPAGYIPEKSQHFACPSNSAYGQAMIDHLTGGVWLQIGSNVWFAIDGISFRAA